jgi:molybdopterin-guanine dinucleotide biosynthesis adapter protein
MIEYPIPVLGFAAFSGTGKTTLLTRLLPQLREKGLRVGMVKHSHHHFDIDLPGKDSYELRKAGAQAVLLASARRWALVVEQEEKREPLLSEVLQRLPQKAFDLILVEGFRHEVFPKIELHRPSLGKPLLFPRDPTIIAIATDAPLPQPCPLPLLDLNRPPVIAEFLLDRCFPNTSGQQRSEAE